MDDSYYQRTLDFVVRIWLEEPPQPGRSLQWRGYIIQVISGRKVYFQDLQVLQEFVASHIGAWREQDDEQHE